MQYYDYYDQESLDLTYEMYATDFKVFGYDTTLRGRPDLLPPRGARAAAAAAPNGGGVGAKAARWTPKGREGKSDKNDRRATFTEQPMVERMSRNILYDDASGRRVSQSGLFASVKANVKESMQSLLQLDKDELLAWIARERVLQESGHKDD